MSSNLSSSVAKSSVRSHHMEMYKSPNRSAVAGTCAEAAIDGKLDSNASPTWRDAYKKRCFDEFKKR